MIIYLFYEKDLVVDLVDSVDSVDLREVQERVAWVPFRPMGACFHP